MLSSALSHSAQHSVEPQLVVALSGLIEEAERAFDTDRDLARSFIARASMILKCDQAKLPGAVEATRAHGGLAPWQLRRAKAYIDENLHLPIHVEDLSELTRLSPSYFSRAFKRSVGHTPQAYVSRTRIGRAQAMMLAGDEPLSQVAVACGFYDQAHLCKVFRRTVGESPNAWRRLRITPDRQRRDGETLLVRAA